MPYKKPDLAEIELIGGMLHGADEFDGLIIELKAHMRGALEKDLYKVLGQAIDASLKANNLSLDDLYEHGTNIRTLVPAMESAFPRLAQEWKQSRGTPIKVHLGSDIQHPGFGAGGRGADS